MKSTLIILVLSISSISFSLAQSINQQILDFSIGFTDGPAVPQLGYQYYFAIGKNKRFFLGPGLRLFGAAGENWRFAETNAPEDNFGDGDPNVNAFTGKKNRMAALNLGFYFKFKINEKWTVGLNTDLLGFGFGQATDGTFTITETGQTISLQDVSPQPLVIFPITGSYNTEMFWISYQINEKFSARIGFLFSDYKYQIDENDLPPGVSEDKYERIYSLGLIGVHYQL